VYLYDKLSIDLKYSYLHLNYNMAHSV